MPDFLTNVVATHLGRRKVIEPRRPARFEPVATLDVDAMLNPALDPDDAVNSDEGSFDSVDKTTDSIADPTTSSQGQSPEQPRPNDHATPLTPARPKVTLVGDPRTEPLLLEPEPPFDRQPRQPSSTPPDTTPQPWPDSETSGSLLPREGDRPEVHKIEPTTTEPSIRPTSDRVEPDPITPQPAYPAPPAIQGSLQMPKLHDLQPHLPSGVGNKDPSFADAIESVHAPDQMPATDLQQIVSDRDNNTQLSSSLISPSANFESRPTLVPAAPAVESLNADRDPQSRQDNRPSTIKVMIGRIEVRAQTTSTSPQPAPRATTRQRYQPKQSLSDYLQKRNEGG